MAALLISGTTIHLYLPLIHSKTDEPALGIPVKSIVQGQGETILLVDDDKSVLLSTSEVLTSLGYRVLTSENGIAALELFDEKSADISLVLTDIVMPKMGGEKLAEAINTRSKTTPIIFSTGYDRKESTQHEPAFSHNTILYKPFSISSLSQSIHESLQRH